MRILFDSNFSLVHHIKFSLTYVLKNTQTQKTSNKLPPSPAPWYKSQFPFTWISAVSSYLFFLFCSHLSLVHTQVVILDSVLRYITLINIQPKIIQWLQNSPRGLRCFFPDIYMVMFTHLLRRFFSFGLNFSRSSSLGRPSLKSPPLYWQTLSPSQVFFSLALITTYSIWLANINFNFLLSLAIIPSPNWNVNFRKLEVYFLIFILILSKYSDPQITPGDSRC